MADKYDRTISSATCAGPVAGFTIEEIEPRLFSFNSPHGACPTCDGLGSKMYFDAALVVPDGGISLRDGAIVPWSRAATPSPYYLQTLEGLAKFYKFSLATKWKELPAKIRNAVLGGSGDDIVPITYDDGMRSYTEIGRAHV